MNLILQLQYLKAKIPFKDLPSYPDKRQGTTANARFSTFAEWVGIAKALTVRNRDATNNLSYRVNNDSDANSVVGPGGSFSYNDMPIDYVAVVPDGVTGNWELQFEVVPREVLARYGFL